MNTFLESQNDAFLVNNIKNGIDQNDSITTLASRHTGLFVKVINSFSRTGSGNVIVTQDDIVNDKFKLVYDAAMSYDENKGATFHSHFANTVRWFCHSSNKSNARHNTRHQEVSPSEIDNLTVDPDVNLSEAEEQNSWVLKNIAEVVDSIEDERARKIIKMRYLCDGPKNTTWNIIAKELNLSVQGAINIHDKCIKAIRSELKKRKLL